MRLLVIPKEDIVSCNYSRIINHFNFLSRNSRILEEKCQSIDVSIFGYDKDPRELFEIPEVMKWFRKSIDHNIPWFYFLSTGEKDAGLLLLLYSTIDNKKIKKVTNGIFLLLERKDIMNFLMINYPILNTFMENNGLDIELNKKICKNITNKLEKQFFSESLQQ